MEIAVTDARHILFVDDEENILSALKRELRPWAKERHVAIETVTSAQGALDQEQLGHLLSSLLAEVSPASAVDAVHAEIQRRRPQGNSDDTAVLVLHVAH